MKQIKNHTTSVYTFFYIFFASFILTLTLMPDSSPINQAQHPELQSHVSYQSKRLDSELSNILISSYRVERKVLAQNTTIDNPLVQALVGTIEKTEAPVVKDDNGVVKAVKGAFVQSASTKLKLPATAEPNSNVDPLPSNSTLLQDQYLFSDKLGTIPLYQGEVTGSEFVLGYKEVFEYSQNGKPFIYGHNNSALSKLRNIHMGDSLFYTVSGSTKEYKVKKIDYISAKETAILDNQQENEIVLITCFSNDSSRRIVVTAELIN